MTYLLTAFGHTALKAEDGEEGLELARREKPDLILCDLQLPEMDGFEVVRRLRDDPQLSKIPVVAVTAFAMDDEGDKVMAAGFEGYIAKPIVPEDFVSQTESFLSKDLRSRTAPPSDVPQEPASSTRSKQHPSCDPRPE
jgi:two-component system, cell cycle response regulator DivK